MCGNKMLDIFESEEVDDEEILKGKELVMVFFVAFILFLLLTISYEMIIHLPYQLHPQKHLHHLINNF
ncbi:Hypothetical protein SRAE_2000315700 [Strongyloides ratti]|uniref:Uncharacterized protein n=1 Tax=Strongyloides ratti TaxID=34506 RepID=A0A090LLR5_STRRB|nr:Hypothetical protein SRAE_2000315700 [Strongyloides ratti]CEF68500.1 Hypothetical protein SRAE_2000315700 [Strongyloides ratti]